MRPFVQGLVVVVVFIACNVVAAGVVLVLGTILQQAAPGWDSPWPWFVICAFAAIAAILFLQGAISYAQGLRRLQWPPRRRGG